MNNQKVMDRKIDSLENNYDRMIEQAKALIEQVEEAKMELRKDNFNILQQLTKQWIPNELAKLQQHHTNALEDSTIVWTLASIIAEEV